MSRLPESKRIRGGFAFAEALEDRRLLAAFDVLVFSRTTAFRHDSIDEGIAAIVALGASTARPAVAHPGLVRLRAGVGVVIDSPPPPAMMASDMLTIASALRIIIITPRQRG